MSPQPPRVTFISTLVLGLVVSTAGDEPLPRVAPLEPAGALKSFETHPGFEMQLLAAEPLVTDPVAMVYDENGLAYVAEMSDYPYTDKATDKPFVERTMDRPIGRVRILEDTDGDGDFDRGTLFAENLSWPTGLALWKGGVFVAATPDIWYLKDTDGDRRADVRRKVFTGFRKYNVQAVMNNLVWGLDHRIYGAGSGNGGQIRPADRPDAKPWVLGRNDYRFDARDGTFEPISGGARFGNTFDDWGNRFVCNIRNPVQHVVLPSRYLARNPYLPVASAVHDAAESGDTLPVYRISPVEAWRVARAARLTAEANPATPRSETHAEGYFTSSSGLTIYRGAAYPREFYGNAFLGEVAGNLVHRQVLSPDGVTFRSVRGDERTEFVRSRDLWFRPVNYVNAPDGTLHVLDMYRETIEHPWSIPDDIKAQLDLESGRDRGRIYRLAPVGFKPPPPPRLGQATVEELVAQLENPNSWWRDTAHRLLFERQDKKAAAPLRKLLSATTSPLGRLHALWSLEGLSALTDDDLLAALADEAPGIREQAVRLSERRLESPRLARRVIAAADDDDIRVRFQVAFTLGELIGRGDEDSIRSAVAAALGRIARRDAADLWVRTAVLSSAGESAAELLSELLADGDFLAGKHAGPLVRDLAVVVGARDKPAEITATLDGLAKLDDGTGDLGTALLIGLGGGLKRSGKRLSNDIVPVDSAPANRIDQLLHRAEQTAADGGAALDRRLTAIDLLSAAEFARSSAVLSALVAPREPQTIQMGAIRALSGYSDAGVAPLLLKDYAAFTPGVRGEVIQALLGRTERIGALLDAVEARRVTVADIPPARRTLLLEHADSAIRQRALRLLSGESATRAVVLAEYRPALKLASDAARGQVVFQRECQACHRLGERGHNVGPNLLSIRNRTPEELVASLLDPNREVAPNFQEYVVALDDGRILTGIISEETATSVTLRRAEGVEETVLRRNIEQISGTGRSLMPEGFEKKIRPQEMADLLAYLLAKP
ncbi:MAG TPA: PVC-type heme-binding CxxCH protein [Pirellulales bacterium]|nr:PVC-type heme-binding CxxCH protein [Pirellulales bacterium]